MTEWIDAYSLIDTQEICEIKEQSMGPKMQGDELLFIVEEDVDGGYFAHAVGQSIVTQADTRDQIAEMVRDAVRCHFDSPEDLPKRVRLYFAGNEVLPG